MTNVFQKNCNGTAGFRRLCLPVLILINLLLLLTGCRTEPVAPVRSGTTTRETSSVAATTVSAEPTGTYDDPVHLTPAAAGRIDLPDFWKEHPFQILHTLPDGRLVLICRSRLSLFDPADGTETTVVEAPYGVQGAANDRFIVYGVGGDEVWAIHCHTIATGTTQEILSDQSGLFGFEVDDQDVFYTTRIKYENLVKMPAVYQSYQLPSGPSSEAIPQDRNHALTALKKWRPEVAVTWSYEDHQPWTDAYLTLDGQLFALTMEYEYTRHNLFNYSLEHLDAKTGMAQLLVEVRGAEEPRISLGRNWIGVNQTVWHDGSWYCADETNGCLYQPIGFAEGQCLLAEVDQNGDCIGLVIAESSS